MITVAPPFTGTPTQSGTDLFIVLSLFPVVVVVVVVVAVAVMV